VIGEDERHLKEHRKRKKAPGEPGDYVKNNGGDTEHYNQAHYVGPSFPRRKDPAEHCRCNY
jgi:hypothetical protein